RNETWRHSRTADTSRCSPRTPFFPARHTGLPDLVDQLLAGVAELEVDGPAFFGLRHVHGALHQLAHRRLDHRPQLHHDRFDTLFPSLVGWGWQRTRRHG